MVIVLNNQGIICDGQLASLSMEVMEADRDTAKVYG